MLILGSMLWKTTGAGAPTPTPTPTPPPSDQPRPAGGFPASEGERRRRTAEDIRRARERYGIADEVAMAIREVAERQAAAQAAAQAKADEQKQFDELYRELELRAIQFDARYLEALAEMRSLYIEQFKRQEEEEILLLLLISAGVAL